MKPADILYTGRLYRFKSDRFYGNRWKETWAVILNDGTLMWYNDKHCGHLKGQELFRNIYPKIEVSESARAKFGEKTPSPPNYHDPDYFFVIPLSPKPLMNNIFSRKHSSPKQVIGGSPGNNPSHPVLPEGGGYQWFCTKSESDLADWILAFATLLGEKAQYRSMQKALSDSRRENQLLIAARGNVDGKPTKTDLTIFTDTTPRGSLGVENNSQLGTLELAAKHTGGGGAVQEGANRKFKPAANREFATMNYGYIWDELKSASSKNSSSRPSISAPIDSVDYRAMVEGMVSHGTGGPSADDDDERFQSASQVLSNSSADATTARIDSIEEVVDNVEIVERRFRAEQVRIFETETSDVGNGEDTAGSGMDFTDSLAGSGGTFSEADFAAYEAAKRNMIQAEVFEVDSAENIIKVEELPSYSTVKNTNKSEEISDFGGQRNEPISLGWKTDDNNNTAAEHWIDDYSAAEKGYKSVNITSETLTKSSSSRTVTATATSSSFGFVEPVAASFQKISIEQPAVISSFMSIDRSDLDKQQSPLLLRDTSAIAMGWRDNVAVVVGESSAEPIPNVAKPEESVVVSKSPSAKQSRFVITSVKNKDLYYAKPYSISTDISNESSSNSTTSSSFKTSQQQQNTKFEHRTMIQTSSKTSLTSNTAASFNMSLDGPTPFSLTKRDSVKSFRSSTPPPLPSCPPPEDDDLDWSYAPSHAPEPVPDPSNFAWFQRRLSSDQKGGWEIAETVDAATNNNKQFSTTTGIFSAKSINSGGANVSNYSLTPRTEIILKNQSFGNQYQQQFSQRKDSGMGDTLEDVSPTTSQTDDNTSMII